MTIFFMSEDPEIFVLICFNNKVQTLQKYDDFLHVRCGAGTAKISLCFLFICLFFCFHVDWALEIAKWNIVECLSLAPRSNAIPNVLDHY